MAATVNRFISDLIKKQAIFEDGKNFGYLTKSLQLKHILSSEEDAHKVRDEAVVYSTDKKMFKVPLALTLKAKDSLLKLHFNKITSNAQVKLTCSDGSSVHFSSDKLLDGFKNYVLEMDKSVQLSIVPPS